MANMFDTRTPIGQRSLDAEHDVHHRLNWLIAANLHEASRRRLFRHGDDEEQLRLMRRPIPTEKAYALFGMMLGLFPSIAIFYRVVGYGFTFGIYTRPDRLILVYCIAMNILCTFVGSLCGSKIGGWFARESLASGKVSLRDLMVAGIGWGAVTGAVAGVIVFGIGAIFGALIVMPIGLVGFVLFTWLHRLVARGGMIDARHFWPLACGVAMFIAALILGR